MVTPLKNTMRDFLPVMQNPRFVSLVPLIWVPLIGIALNACTPAVSEGVGEATTTEAVAPSSAQVTDADMPDAQMPDAQMPDADMPDAQMPAEGLVVKASAHDVDETTARLTKVLEAKGLTVFTTIDHQANAAGADLELPPTRVVIFGNAKLGTPLMQCAPSLAIDLPQKVLIWQDEAGVKLAYNDPQHLAQRHRLDGCGAEVLKKITGALDGLTQQAVDAS